MKKERIAFALQGGGSHGAFTWGVMEKLLEEDIFDIRGFCGTSAGAMNSAIIVHGLQKNGNKGAIELLEQFWKEISRVSAFIIPQPTWIDNYVFNGNMDFSPIYQMFNFWKDYLSPYQFNPLNISPLKDVLSRLIDFEELKTSKIKLFISATNVKKGSCKVFCPEDISLDALLASASLPYMSQAVEVEGEYFWDGGYTGNPPIYPLIYGTDSNDVLLIQINPIWNNTIPKSIANITDRVNEVTFNESLKAEMRMITRGYELQGAIKDNYFHLISADDFMNELDFSSKINTSWEFLTRLRIEGRKVAEKWIEEELKFVGKKTSDQINKKFGDSEGEWLHEMVHKPAKNLKQSPIDNGKKEIKKSQPVK